MEATRVTGVSPGIADAASETDVTMAPRVDMNRPRIS
jgi:hypothetical protein